MTENRIESLRKELSIRRGIAKDNLRFCREIEKEIEVLEHENT